MDKSQMTNEELIAANHPEEPDEVDGAAVANPADNVDPPKVEDPPVDPKDKAQDTPAIPAPAADGTRAAPAADQPQGHDRTIVKAARAGEARARKDLHKAQQRIAELEALVPKPAEVVEKKPNADVLKDVKNYAPEAGEYIEQLEQQVETLKKSTPPPAPEPAEFVPPPLHADPEIAEALQDELDEVPDLVAWHQDPDQSRWKRVRAIDHALAGSPDWEGKPLRERFAEVARMVNAESERAKPAPKPPAAAPSPEPEPKKALPTAADAHRVIKEKAREEPVSVGDLRGKAPPNTSAPSKRDTWANMTNDQLIAQLPEYPE